MAWQEKRVHESLDRAERVLSSMASTMRDMNACEDVSIRDMLSLWGSCINDVKRQVVTVQTILDDGKEG